MITISKTVSPSFLARNVTEYIVLCVIIGGVYTGQLIHEIANNQTLLYALYSFRQVTRSIVQKLSHFHGCVGDQREGNSKVRAIPI
jgi:hypothetical protein